MFASGRGSVWILHASGYSSSLLLDAGIPFADPLILCKAASGASACDSGVNGAYIIYGALYALAGKSDFCFAVGFVP